MLKHLYEFQAQHVYVYNKSIHVYIVCIESYVQLISLKQSGTLRFK